MSEADTDFPRTPPEQRGAYVYGPVLHRWFAGGAALLLLSVVWMVMQDYEREWKQHQREFRGLKKERLTAELDDEKAFIKAEDERLKAELKAAHEIVAARAAEIQKIEAAVLAQRQLEFYAAEQAVKFSKSELDTALNRFEEARKQGGDHAAATAAYEHWRDAYASASEEQRRVENDVKAKDEAIAGHRKVAVDIHKKIAELNLRRDTLDRNLAKLQFSVANVIRDIPLLDFIDPNYKVKQRVLNDFKLDYSFAEVVVVDRCETCHQGIDDPYWNRDAVKNPHKAHPRLDLYLHGASPHPVEDFGCTICHSGRPSATEFYQAGHTPDSDPKAHDWHHKGYHTEHYDEWWNRPMLPTKYAEAGCNKCHGDAVELAGAEKLLQGKRLFRDLGCYGCHKASGMLDVSAGGDLPRRGPDLTKIASKTTEGWAHQWIANPKHFRPTTRMPRFYGLSNNSAPEDQRREATEIRAIVRYLWKHSERVAYPNVRGDARQGEQLVNGLGCLGCHRVADPVTVDAAGHATAPTAGVGGRDHGPELSRIGAKTSTSWLAAWVRDPKAYSTSSRMPSLRLTDDEARHVAAYLGTLTGGAAIESQMPDPDPAEVDRILTTSLRERMTADRAAATLAGDFPSFDSRVLEVGKLAIRRQGCAGCHSIPGDDFKNESKIGVAFTEDPIGSKPLNKLDYGLLGIGHGVEEIAADLHPPAGVPHTLHDWIRRKLQNPRVYDWGKEKAPKDRLRMPDFSISEADADALVTYLLGITKDKVPAERKPAADGPLAREQRGWKLVREHNCIGCHELAPQTVTVRQSVRIPDYDKATGAPRRGPDDAPLIVNAIGVDKREKIAEMTLGGRITDEDEEFVTFELHRAHPWLSDRLPPSKLNLAKVDGKSPVIRGQAAVGGAIAEALIPHIKAGKRVGDEVARVFTPPSLVGEGDKVQAPWLFGFLKNVETLRPWLDVRMPTFALPDEEARAIAEFFVARSWRERRAALLQAGTEAAGAARKEIDRKVATLPYAYPFEQFEHRSADYVAAQERKMPGYLRRARAFFDHPNVKCATCHVQGGVNPPGDPSGWAPDLDRARTRLRPEWIMEWLENPAALQPGTKMPKFGWKDMGNDLFPGSAEERKRALTDLLMNFDRVPK